MAKIFSKDLKLFPEKIVLIPKTKSWEFAKLNGTKRTLSENKEE